MIAFLHTNKVHIERFEALVKQFNPAIKTKHFVNKDILDDALATGETDTFQFNKEIETIRQAQPSLIICTCSTFGAESDKHVDVHRIDKPIITHLVENYTKIGLAFTANSTKVVSENLLLKIASEKQKSIDIVDCDCSEFWPYFEDSNFEDYTKNIAKNISKLESHVDVMFLAQASMEGAKDYLTDFKKEVFTSPEFGIRELLKMI